MDLTDAQISSARAAQEALARWIWDHIDDGPLIDFIPDEEQVDELEAHVRRAITTICDWVGHKVVNDHCGKPAHRFCEHCLTRQPDAEVTR